MIRNNILSRYPLILFWLTSLSQVLALLVIYQGVSPITFQTVMMFSIVTILVIFSYVCSVVHFKSILLKFFLYVSINLLMWQLILNSSISSSVMLLTDLLNPIIFFMMIFSAISIILLGKQWVGKELFVTYFLVVLITVGLFFINKGLFVTFSFFCSLFTSLLPIIFLVMYAKELKTILGSQRRYLVILSVWATIFLILTYEVSNVSLLIWYLGTFILISFFHLRIIFEKFSQVVKNVKKEYIGLIFRIFFGSIITFIVSCLFLQLDAKLSFLLLNFYILIFAFAFIQSFQVFGKELNEGSSEHFKTLFLKRNTMVKELLEDEEYKNQFSEFLHNDILQSVIAIKNFNKQGDKPIFREQINQISQSVITEIRERLDTYQPFVEGKQSIAQSYREMIARIVAKSHTEREIHFQVDDNIILLSPYDLIVYRLLEELANNSIKDSTRMVSNLELWTANDMIHIHLENGSDESVNRIGYGLRFIEQRTLVLGGNYSITNENGTFSVYITIPIDKGLCHENFID